MDWKDDSSSSRAAEGSLTYEDKSSLLRLLRESYDTANERCNEIKRKRIRPEANKLNEKALQVVYSAIAALLYATISITKVEDLGNDFTL